MTPTDAPTACSGPRPTHHTRTASPSSATRTFITASPATTWSAYYKKHYVPNNIVFVVVGDVERREGRAGTPRPRQKSSRWAPSSRSFVPSEPPQLSLRERHEETPTQISQDRSRVARAVGDPDRTFAPSTSWPSCSARARVRASTANSSRNAVWSTASMPAATHPAIPGIFTISASTDPDKRDAAIVAIREQVKLLIDQPVTEEELQKAIKLTTSHYLDGLKTMAGQASDIANNEFLLGDPNYSRIYLENLRKVTLDDLQRVIRKYFTDNNLTITSLESDRVRCPNHHPLRWPSRKSKSRSSSSPTGCACWCGKIRNCPWLTFTR